MAVTQTTYLHLTKVDYDEYADVAVNSGNMDIIDTAVHNLQNAGSANSGKYMKVGSDGAVAPAALPTVTTSAAGMMSAADKTKLNGIATGATKVVFTGDVAVISIGPLSPDILAEVKHEITIPAGKAPFGITGYYPNVGNFQVRGIQMTSDANNKHYISLKLKTPAGTASDIIYVSYALINT